MLLKWIKCVWEHRHLDSRNYVVSCFSMCRKDHRDQCVEINCVAKKLFAYSENNHVQMKLSMPGNEFMEMRRK